MEATLSLAWTTDGAGGTGEGGGGREGEDNDNHSKKCWGYDPLPGGAAAGRIQVVLTPPLEAGAVDCQLDERDDNLYYYLMTV